MNDIFGKGFDEEEEKEAYDKWVEGQKEADTHD